MRSSANQNVVSLKDFRVADLGSQVAKALTSAGDQLVDRLQSARSSAHLAVRSTDKFVRTSPWQAVAAIALVGVAAGIVLSLGARRLQDDDARRDVRTER